MSQTSSHALSVEADADLLPAMELVHAPRTTRVLAVVLILLSIVTLAALIFSPWQQNVSGTGRVVAFAPTERQQTIDAPIEGRISKWFVVEGTRVKKGEVVAELVDNDPSLPMRLREERDAVQRRLDAARSREQSLAERIVGLESSRRAAIDGAGSRILMAEDRVRSAEQALEAAEANVITTNANIDRQKKLEAKGLTSTRNVELAELDHRRAVTDVTSRKASLSAARSERLAFDAERNKVEADFKASIEDARASRAAAQSEIASSVAALQQMEVRVSRQQRQIVTAPVEGTVFRLMAQPGDFLKAGDPVASFVPDLNTYGVEVYVSGNDMPLITPGRHVRVQFEGWPAVPFVGWPSAAIGTYGGKVALVDSTDNGQGKFRVLVTPDENDEKWPTKNYLRQGVRANGFILLNTVPLGFELWRQLNGFPPVVNAPADAGKGEKK